MDLNLKDIQGFVGTVFTLLRRINLKDFVDVINDEDRMLVVFVL